MTEKINPEFEIKGIDIAVSAMNSALAVLPIIGPLMSELVGFIIPNQRFDRLIKYLTQLEKKLGKLDNSILKLALQDENFTDLTEESLRQAARSLSDERRDYIASVIENSLTSENIDFIEAKHVLKILGEINDIEVIWLRFYLCHSVNNDIEFRHKHEKILQQQHPNYGAPQKEIDKFAFQISYKEHLVEIGLLGHEYEPATVDINGKVSGSNTIRSYYLTSFGKILLRQINLYKDC